ncbi:hypothetical protein B0J18DRAFT_455928 [Chaetomium sp. MPI-SDFR-AT-0129]|nr:hypothetical protein B0J18DRAFT_455928 [Chaetomium sp. MPI-SDFR-AT-0129]
MTGRRRQQQQRGRAAKNSAYILEDEAEPLDLLDRNALANISTTKPDRRPSALRNNNNRRMKARTDADGKLILGGEDGAMDVDDSPSAAVAGAGGAEEKSGVGAYVAALRGKDVPRRGLRGKLKWNRGRKDADGGDDDDEGSDGGGPMDVDEGAAAKAFRDRAGGNNNSNRKRGGDGKGRGGGGFGRGRGGGGGGRGGNGGIAAAAGRRGLGQDRRRGPAIHGSRVSKGGKGGRS